MSYQQTGKIVGIDSTQQVSEKFSKRNFVIEFQDGNYTKQLALQFTQAKCELLDKFSTGQDVTVHFNLESKLYNGNWYTNANAWKIEGSAVATQPTTSQSGGASCSDLPF